MLPKQVELLELMEDIAIDVTRCRWGLLRPEPHVWQLKDQVQGIAHKISDAQAILFEEVLRRSRVDA